MSDIREELERVFAADDKAKASFERDEWQCAQRAKRSAAPAGVDVDEWLASRPKPKPMPQPQRQQPQQQRPVLDRETQILWNSWCDRRILKFVGPDGALFNAMAEAFALFREAERKHMREHVADEIKKQLDAEATKLREEIAGLRIDEVVGRSVLRGEINELREAGAKKKART